MIFQYYTSFARDYKRLPLQVRAQVDAAIALFEENPRHPSLQIKKMKGSENIWEGRVTRSYRFTFEWDGEVVTFRRVGTHDILEKEARRE